MSLSRAQKAKLAEINAQAKENFPGDEASIAFANFIRSKQIDDVMFLKNGERHMWKKDINCGFRPSFKDFPTIISDDQNRAFLFRRSDTTAKERLALVDKKKRRTFDTFEAIAPLIAHRSEAQWNLDVNHKRHILNFPSEIPNLILEFALCLPLPLHLGPSVVTCNWKAEWQQPEYVQRTLKPGTSRYIIEDESSWVGGSLVRFDRRYDRQGPYTLMRRIVRKDIDATVLRTSKKLQAIGAKLLYGRNSFFFPMVNGAWRKSPPSMFEDKKMYRPYPGKPSVHHGDTENNIKIEYAVQEIWHQVPLMSLSGWAYYDHFLRFLRTIGPKNASYTKHLTFTGMAQVHNCQLAECDAGYGSHREDLVGSIRVYVPFIIQFCPDLESLTIIAAEDSQREFRLDDDQQRNTEEVVLPLLENCVTKIESLRYLKVIVRDWDREGEELHTEPDFAEPIIRAIAEKGAQRARDARDPELKKQPALVSATVDTVHCAFCGEDHVWAECHNLGDFCGAFGHFRPGCKALHLEDEAIWRMGI